MPPSLEATVPLTAQVAPEPPPHPLHPDKTAPLLAVAVSITGVPLFLLMMRRPPRSTPSSYAAPFRPPVPSLLTVSATPCCRLNVAVTDFDPLPPSRGGRHDRQRDDRPPPPSLTRASGITALGSSDPAPCASTGLGDVWALQRIHVEEFLVDGQGERPTARTPVEPLLPGSPDHPIEPRDTPEVRRSPVVLVVAPKYRVEGRLLLRERIVPVSLSPRRNPQEAPVQSLPHGPHVRREVPPPTPPPY